MTDRPSQIRVFGKSIFVFAAGWVISIAWLWFAGFQQHVLRHGAAPPGYAMETLSMGLLPGAGILVSGWIVRRLTGPAPAQALERQEWWHAFWWSLVPNWLLLTTVWVMIREGR